MTEQTYKSATPEQHARQKNGQGLTAEQIAAAGINKDDHPKHFVDYGQPKCGETLNTGSVKGASSSLTHGFGTEVAAITKEGELFTSASTAQVYDAQGNNLTAG